MENKIKVMVSVSRWENGSGFSYSSELDHLFVTNLDDLPMAAQGYAEDYCQAEGLDADSFENGDHQLSFSPVTTDEDGDETIGEPALTLWASETVSGDDSLLARPL